VSGLPRGNPAAQGYCLPPAQLRELRFAVRFPVALCLALAAMGVALESPAILLALAPIGLIAGFSPRHPFDLIWNHAGRHLGGGAELPPNPPMRRNAFKLGTAWLVVTAILFAVGATLAGVVVGSMLLAACASAAVLNFCVPSALFTWAGTWKGGTWNPSSRST
jgi:hypothetical protein